MANLEVVATQRVHDDLIDLGEPEKSFDLKQTLPGRWFDGQRSWFMTWGTGFKSCNDILVLLTKKIVEFCNNKSNS